MGNDICPKCGSLLEYKPILTKEKKPMMVFICVVCKYNKAIDMKTERDTEPMIDESLINIITEVYKRFIRVASSQAGLLTLCYFTALNGPETIISDDSELREVGTDDRDFQP